MLKSFLIKIITAYFFLGVIFQPNTKKTRTSNKDVIFKITKNYTNNFYLFRNEVNELEKISNLTFTKNDIEKLQEQFIKTRLAFKQIEFIFDYDQTGFNNLYINSAPIPKVELEYTGGTIIQPNGLQTIDELIFDDIPFNNIKEIQKLTKELKEKVALITNTHLPIKIVDNSIIEALRSGVIRTFALGLSGFDTPGCANILEEAIVSLKSMHDTFKMFNETLHKKAKPEYKSINKLYKKGISILKSQDNFDDFDHLYFLKTIVNPLYSKLLEFQKNNGISLERYKFHAQNYSSKTFFSEDFLDTDYYGYFTYQSLSNPASIKLGKKLFEDPILSNNSKMSCVTCHNPKKGFSDGLPKSSTNRLGVPNKRNSSGLIDVGYSTKYFWDVRDTNLERQVTHVIDNELEFNTDFKTIARKLSRNPVYIKLFDEAYGDISKNDINQRSISNAIAAYVNSLKSFNSDFDKFIRNETKSFPEDAYRGFNIFMGKAACATCHFVPVFNGTVPPFYTDSESEVLGVTVGLDSINPVLDTDLGRMANGLRLDNQPFYKNAIKTVTVRNIELTAPYMHNGSFSTLEEVIEFYNLGGGKGMGLQVENQTLSDERLNLSEREKKDLIAFLKTLTDTSGLE